MRRRLASIVLIGILMTLAAPALAASEGGYQSCSSDGHVYTKNQHVGYWNSWIDVTADGNREAYEYGYDADWSNRYTSAPDSVNSAYYGMYGDQLDTVWSWPGCEAD